MFTFALTIGVKNGWLTDPKYAAAARRGWIAIANKTNAKGRMDRVCPGTGAAPPETLRRSSSSTRHHARLERHARPGAAAVGRDRAPRPDCPGVR